MPQMSALGREPTYREPAKNGLALKPAKNGLALIPRWTTLA